MTTREGITTARICVVILLALKLEKQIEWSWYFVLSPLLLEYFLITVVNMLKLRRKPNG